MLCLMIIAAFKFRLFLAMLAVLGLVTVDSAVTLTDDTLDAIERALKADNTAEALELAAGLAAFSPLDAEAQALYGLALIRVGRFHRAEEALLIALGLDEACADAHLGMGCLARGRNQIERAAYHLREASRSSRFRGEALSLLSGVLAENGDISGALKAAEMAAGVDDRAAESLRSMITLYRFIGPERCLLLPESFQMTTADLVVPNGESGPDVQALELTINGVDAGMFILDTAYQGNLIVSKALAERLGLETAGSFTLRVPGGNELAAEGSLLNTIGFGGLTIGRVPVSVLQSPRFTGGIEGLIGIGLLKQFNFVVDFRGGTLQLSRADRPDLLLRRLSARNVAARLPFFLGPAPLVEVGINGVDPARFVIATAEAASALDEAFFEKNVAPALPPGSVLTGGDSKLTGAEEGRLLSGATVALGGIEIEDTPLALLDLASIGEVGGPKVAGIVGRDILLRYRLIFDFADSVLILESYAK